MARQNLLDGAYVFGSQANPPVHKGDVSKPGKFWEPRKPPTEEEAGMDFHG